MSSSVDLRELAIDRNHPADPKVRTHRHIVSRYVIPGLLVLGFISLVTWASWDILFPPQEITVIPVFSTTSEVQQEGMPLFKAAGWIEPRPTTVRVAALAPGVVEKLLVIEDQPVKAGEPIAVLVNDDAQLACQRAMADMQLRQAELTQAEAALAAAVTRFEQPVHLQAALAEAEATLAKIETELNNLPFVSRRAAADYEAALRDFEGKRDASEVIAGIKIDIARSIRDSKKALVEELEDRLISLKKERAALAQRRDALKTQLDLLADEIKAKDEAEANRSAARARVAQAEVAVAVAKLQLDRMTIRAPMEGRIFRLFAHPGARIGSGMTQMTGHDGSTIVTMYDPMQLQVRVDVRFEDIPKVLLDQPVEINNPTLKSPITGNVLFVSSEADIQKNTLQVKVGIPDPPPVFKPEMLVDVTFLAPRKPDRATVSTREMKLYVPQQLIQQEQDGSYIWIADQSHGTARKVKVETGKTGNNGLVEIKSGLNISSRVISSGSDGLKDGARIRVTSEDDALGLSTPIPLSGRSKSQNRLPTGDNQ